MTIVTSKWTKLLSGAARFLPEAPWVAIVVELVSQLAAHMGATSGDSKESLRHIAALHADLSQITSAHASLSPQISAQSEAIAQQSEKLDALTAEVRFTQAAAVAIQARICDVESRFAALETQGTRTFTLALAGCLLTIACLVLLVFVLLRLH